MTAEEMGHTIGVLLEAGKPRRRARYVLPSGGISIQTMSDVRPSRRGRAPFLLASGGVACALAVLPVAFFAPVYSGESSSSTGTVATTNTLVGVNGLWIVWLLCVPAFLAVMAWTGLHFRCSRGSSWGTRVAWASVVLLWALALIGIASVGFFLIPTALLLVVAATQTPTALRITPEYRPADQ